MTVDEFIKTNNGKYLDYDGAFGAQCVDVVLYYCRDVILTPALWGNAVDIFGEQPTKYEWIKNQWGNITQFPSKGDIVVWGQNYKVGTGIYGHIAIVHDANGASFNSFDQNWPPGSPCHMQHHTYDGVIGWGRPKIVAPSIPSIPFGLAPLSFGQFIHSGRSDLHTGSAHDLLGQYLKEQYPNRKDLQPNGRSDAQWLLDLLGEMITEIRV